MLFHHIAAFFGAFPALCGATLRVIHVMLLTFLCTKNTYFGTGTAK